ncbi:transglycosylase SLT domain-containing protein [Neolewinella lacunae]|uniref:Transglycosylase SLT domain-containing protein n=1 Tax=Neolewinella lacunae TaxID=1517758 RepID=A0A923T6N7_9BACT|nr:lytic transglycosylase domain-containing protein [Neolewinella lacunae]MBC6992786.1 transglycosylase SLT domain-containing protein [Neolewinella lacunae]MDN3636030.1 transglycosylase SLT domain-containing protein [Neolewinella lacunae]
MITRFCLFLLLCGIPSLGAAADDRASAAAAALDAQAEHIMAIADSVVRRRLALLDNGMVEHRFDPVVKRRIINYLENWPITSARLLARSARFFPIFEEQLAAAGLPTSLKYISVQESALRPWATSHVGAGGLWQLMPGTARELGLTVDATVDERLDPELGCAAGLAYLKMQYDRYQDWALALAAYNCGPGNVNRALRRSKSRDYWKIRKHLPGETRDYVPYIIAAAYLMAFHHEHEVTASAMELDLQMTEAITVYRELSLHRVAQVTRLRPEVVIELNPQYLRGYLPGRPGGHRLRLPQRVMPAMQTYLETHPATRAEAAIALPWTSPRLHDGEMDPDRFYTGYHTVPGTTDTTLRAAAATFGLPVDQLAVWSNLGELDPLEPGDELFFYRVEIYLPYDPRVREVPPAAPPIASLATVPLAVPGFWFDRSSLPVPNPAPAAAPGKMSLLRKIGAWFK